MKKIMLSGVLLCLLGAIMPLGCQVKPFSQGKKDPYKSRSAQPALPYGPKNQEPWNKSRAFEEADFQQGSEFELQRQETENLRHQVLTTQPD